MKFCVTAGSWEVWPSPGWNLASDIRQTPQKRRGKTFLPFLPQPKTIALFSFSSSAQSK